MSNTAHAMIEPVRSIAERHRVIDADTHVVEPYDLWTARVSTRKWGDKVPHVRRDESSGIDYWYFGDEQVWTAAGSAFTGWDSELPSRPPTMDHVKSWTYNAEERLKVMDEYGIHAQLLYPNVAGIGAGKYMTLSDPELMLACVEAYNDWLVDWASADRKRLIPQMAMPLWDVDLCVKEMDRCAKNGHKGVVMCGEPEFFGLPVLTHPHWDPLWSAAQDMGLPINFHVATGDFSPFEILHESAGEGARNAAAGVTFFLMNGSVMAQLIAGGLCHKYPRLNFVSVESGVGWIPYLLESLDWLWLNTSARKENPERDLMPTEYFQRQMYACFMHERDTLLNTVKTLGANNFLFETDFPHPSSLTPGPASTAPLPSEYLDDVIGGLPEPQIEALVRGNAARIYNID